MSINQLKGHLEQIFTNWLPRAECRRDDGFALLIVLWTLVLIAFVVGHLIATGRTEIRIASNLVANAACRLLPTALSLRRSSTSRIHYQTAYGPWTGAGANWSLATVA
jgi:Tfp pilus assembly protein PilX